jgi:hypothetical protein
MPIGRKEELNERQPPYHIGADLAEDGNHTIYEVDFDGK